MTAKRGTLWKTSWRRQKPSLGGAPVPMQFFYNFDVSHVLSWYKQALDTPTVGGVSAGSFWMGMIAGLSDATISFPAVLRGSIPATSDWVVFGAEAGGSLQAAATVDAVPLTQDISGLGVTSPTLRAVVIMLTVDGSGSPVNLWVDGNLRVQSGLPGTYAATAARFGIASPNNGYLNSWAGGNVLPTTAEIKTWFAATRSALAAQPITGKTLDRFDAGAVPVGLAPTPLVNLSTGQNMVLTSGGNPFGQNGLFDASFGY